MNPSRLPSLVASSMTLVVGLAIACVLALALSPMVVAADTSAVTSPTLPVEKRDVEFIQQSNQCGLLVTKVSELAIQRNLSGQNLDFAKQVVSDHKSLDKDLTALASKRGITLPTALDEDTQKKYDSFAKTEDTKLAKEYLAFAIKEHKKAVSAFKDAAADSKDADVRAFAAQYLPQLQVHLDEAKRLKDVQ